MFLGSIIILLYCYLLSTNSNKTIDKTEVSVQSPGTAFATGCISALPDRTKVLEEGEPGALGHVAEVAFLQAGGDGPWRNWLADRKREREYK